MENRSFVQILSLLQTFGFATGHQDKGCATNIYPSSGFHYGWLGFVGCASCLVLLFCFEEYFFSNNSLNVSKSSVMIKLTPVSTTCPSTTVLYWFILYTLIIYLPSGVSV